MAQEGGEQRWHPSDKGRPDALDGPQEIADVARVRDEGQRIVPHQRDALAGNMAVGMEQGQWHEDDITPVFPDRPEPGVDLQPGGD